MKKIIFILLSLLGLITTDFSVSFAAGFAINVHGAKPSGMSEAFAARADDPSTIFYNPAGINQLKGTNLSLETTVILPNVEFNSDIGNNSEQDRQAFFPSTLYITHQIDNRFSAGLGIFSPFGLGTKWPKDWEGRFMLTLSEIKTIFINPALSWQITPDLSVAGGFDYVFTDVRIERQINMELYGGAPSSEGDISLKGNDTGSGYNLGLLYRIDPDLNVGLTYRSPVKLEVNDGDADFTVPAGFESTFSDSKIKTDITLPPTIILGMIFSSMLKDLALEFDLTWTGWSKIDRLAVEFLDNNLPTDITELNWDDVFSYRFGGEYRWSESILLRGGYAFEKSPMPEDKYTPAILPDGDRHIISFGGGYDHNNGFGIDLFYQIILIKGDKNNNVGSELKSTNVADARANGEYKTTVNLAGIGVKYHF
ncbi:MAG: OmpP1/FadL family transporter [Nitrospirota bacterium]